MKYVLPSIKGNAAMDLEFIALALGQQINYLIYALNGDDNLSLLKVHQLHNYLDSLVEDDADRELIVALKKYINCKCKEE